jgi:hypothetical protein
MLEEVAKPVFPSCSSFEPTWYQTLTATMGALWSSCTIRVKPLSRTVLVKGMSTNAPSASALL